MNNPLTLVIVAIVLYIIGHILGEGLLQTVLNAMATVIVITAIYRAIKARKRKLK